MKKTPRKIKQWADEAYLALGTAWSLLREQYPDPSEEEKLELVNFAPALAGLNRDIKDKAKIKKAYSFVLERTLEDLRLAEEDEPPYHSILFLLAYLDTHISFGILSEKKKDDVMEFLCESAEIENER